MFTLPVNKATVKSIVPDGKVEQPSLWNLTVILQPGVIKHDGNWYPGENHPHFDQHEITAEILFGNQSLLKTRLGTQQIVFSKNLIDTITPATENLIIKLLGKPVDPDLEQDNHVILKIDAFIENLPIMPLFETYGYYELTHTHEHKTAGDMLGENGQQVLEIYTPIYVWLLQHQKVFSQYAQKS
jgi:hypothetical protein